MMLYQIKKKENYLKKAKILKNKKKHLNLKKRLLQGSNLRVEKIKYKKKI